jgi:hypothetical protein
MKFGPLPQPPLSTTSATGTLTFQVKLKGKSSTTVWFAIAGPNADRAKASGALTYGLEAGSRALRQL